MSGKRKISVRKIIQTLVTLVAVTGCVLALLSADRQQRNRRVRDVSIQIRNASEVQFLTEDAVREMLFKARHVDPRREQVNRLDEHSMEAILQSNPWVREAQVFTDAEARLHINVHQRIPAVRVFELSGDSYYLDTSRRSMPLCSRFSSYVPVITGVPHLGNDSMGQLLRGEILGLVNYFSARPFWNAQVSQIVMRPDYGFELIPVLGSQRIIIGDTSNLAEKLDNLFAFYKQVQNRLGWDQYRSIDLRYKGQIVASPALKWKIPVDRALSNFNWLKAIMESAPSKQDPGGDGMAFADSLDRNSAAVRNTGTSTAPASPAQNQQPANVANPTKKRTSPEPLKGAEKNTRTNAKIPNHHAAANR